MRRRGVSSNAKEERVGIRNFIPAWSVVRQVRGNDRLGLGEAAQSSLQAGLQPRTAEADEVTPTLKLKRRVCEEHFAAEIDALYA